MIHMKNCLGVFLDQKINLADYVCTSSRKILIAFISFNLNS